MGFSPWSQAKSLIFLPSRTLVSNFKVIPISQVDTCQLAPSISWNKTPLEMARPRVPTCLPHSSVHFSIFQENEALA